MFTYKSLRNGSREEVNKWADEREKVKFTSSSVDELSYRELKLSEKRSKQRPANEKDNKQVYQGNMTWVRSRTHGQHGMEKSCEVSLHTDHFWISQTVQTTLNYVCAVHYCTVHYLTENIKCIWKPYP